MNNRTIARLQIPAPALPSTPSTVRRLDPEPGSWPQSPVLRRPSNKSHVRHPTTFSSLEWEQRLLPSTNSSPTSLLTPTQGCAAHGSPCPQSHGEIEFPNPLPPSSESNDSEEEGTAYSPDDSKDYFCGSILKKQNFANGCSSDGSLRQPQHGGRRKVVFKNSVSVYWYDSDAESACSPTDCEHFNLESRDRRLFAEENATGTPRISELCRESGRCGVQRSSSKRRQESSCPGVEQNFRDCTPTVLSSSPVGVQVQRKQTILPQLVLDNRTPFCATPRGFTSGRCAQFSFIHDQEAFGRKLVVAIPLSPDLHPYDVLVKANKSGNKIRVVISKDAGLGNGTGYGAKELISLPVEVDPYQLSARLDRGGTLHVEAPVV